jgi:hypothetical protein
MDKSIDLFQLALMYGTHFRVGGRLNARDCLT